MKKFGMAAALSALFIIIGCKTANLDMTWSSSDDYFSYYSLDLLQGWILSGWEESGNDRLWTWSVSPENYTQTVLFIHGYLDHSALNLTLFDFLNQQNYRIIAFDLPGHGRSGGQRGALFDFDEYSNSLKRIMNYWDLEYGDTVFIGHSTGGALILDSLIEGVTMKVAVLAAPLVQFRHFDKASFLINNILKGDITIAASKKKSSSHKEFNEKKRTDPMTINQMPLNWPRAIIKWYNSLPDYEISRTGSILVLQGERDHVVYYERNLEKILQWFPRAQIQYYPRLMHHLLNEKETDDLYSDLLSFLERVNH